MKRKLWFLKGVTGETVREQASFLSGPVEIGIRNSTVFVFGPGAWLSLTVRGSSKCRRKMARQLKFWLSENWGSE